MLDRQDEEHAACKCVSIGMPAGNVSYSIGYYLGSLDFLLLQTKGGEQTRQAKVQYEKQQLFIKAIAMPHAVD